MYISKILFKRFVCGSEIRQCLFHNLLHPGPTSVKQREGSVSQCDLNENPDLRGRITIS